MTAKSSSSKTEQTSLTKDDVVAAPTKAKEATPPPQEEEEEEDMEMSPSSLEMTNGGHRSKANGPNFLFHCSRRRLPNAKKLQSACPIFGSPSVVKKVL